MTDGASTDTPLDAIIEEALEGRGLRIEERRNITLAVNAALGAAGWRCVPAADLRQEAAAYEHVAEMLHDALADNERLSVELTELQWRISGLEK
jgi:hypothetical protein